MTFTVHNLYQLLSVSTACEIKETFQTELNMPGVRADPLLGIGVNNAQVVYTFIYFY